MIYLEEKFLTNLIVISPCRYGKRSCKWSYQVIVTGVRILFLQGANIEREELLALVVEGFVYAKSNYTNTLLGKPREVSLAEGKLDGVCMALGLEYEIKNKVIVFKTFLNEKVILELPFDPQEPF